MKAQVLWKAILEAQIETGTPYMVYKDACNRKSNQQNLGTIKSSNLCTEIVEYTSPEEVGVFLNFVLKLAEVVFSICKLLILMYYENCWKNFLYKKEFIKLLIKCKDLQLNIKN